MFKRNRTVAWSGFNFLTFKTHVVPECQGPVVTKAPSQKTLRGGPFWGRLWTAPRKVAGKGTCSPRSTARWVQPGHARRWQTSEFVTLLVGFPFYF